ncbi:hypothetical protein AB6A40_001265 [Gnathostoma spinigerum]|uniref:CX domain-containing protein n=1 Tax=Gnathostoma spinigerum TaxID=75299 RepID=A0ABD6E520_9BILA
MAYKVVFFCLLLLFDPVDNRKQTFGGGRGQSSSRKTFGNQPTAFQPQPQPPRGGGFQQGSYPGGYQHPAGGYQPRPGGYPPQSGFRPNQGGFNSGGTYAHNPGFRPGTGPGSVSSGSRWKTALAAGALGAVGGVVTYELGKAVINSMSSPFHVNNRPYYWGNEYYQPKNGYFMCSMPLDEVIKQTKESTPATTASPSNNETEASATTPQPDNVLANVQFKDGTRPKTISWGCKVGTEVCCGTECCPAPVGQSPGNSAHSKSSGHSIVAVVLGVVIAFLLLMCCCCCIAFKLFRSAFDSCCGKVNDEPNVVYTDTTKYDDNTYPSNGGYGQSYVASQTYPMQSYPQQTNGYPPTEGYTYPAQPPPFQAYPNQQHY